MVSSRTLVAALRKTTGSRLTWLRQNYYALIFQVSHFWLSYYETNPVPCAIFGLNPRPSMNAKLKQDVRRMLHRNGVVAVEENLRGQTLHGRRRTWHRNGKLATEEFYFDGLLHGVVRQWNEKGRLLGSFRMEHGTGTQKSWYDNGQLNQEFATIAGEFCGRSRMWLRDGTLISDRVVLS